MGRIIVAYFFILIGIFSCSKGKVKRLSDIITDTKFEYAPDSRTSVFDIEVKGVNPTTIKGETNFEEAKSALLRRFDQEGIKVVDEISVLPGKNIGEKKYALINVSVANLRIEPTHSAELVTQALLGTPVKLLKEEKGWYLIQTPDDYISWANEGSLEKIGQQQLADWKQSKKVVYLNTYGYSISPDKNKRVSDLVAGNILLLEKDHNEYYEVSYPDNRWAIIPKSEANDLQNWIERITISDNSIAEAALNLSGIPYMWGGTSTKALDCSGFTKMVYMLHGMVIPRDASQQVNEGILIDSEKDFSKLQVGDLLFFGRKNNDLTEHVVHVGLWLGNDQFIHASGDVHISSIDSLSENFDSYNYNRYLRAKRIIGSQTNSIYNLIEFYN